MVKLVDKYIDFQEKDVPFLIYFQSWDYLLIFQSIRNVIPVSETKWLYKSVGLFIFYGN